MKALVATALLSSLSLLASCAPPPPPTPPTPEPAEAPAPQAEPDPAPSPPAEQEAAPGELGAITELGLSGVSPHMEATDNGYRLYYASIEVGGLAVDNCTAQWECSNQVVLQRMADLTIVETGSGERRGYWVELNPDTKDKEIFTGLVSADGSTTSGGTSLGFSSEGQMAWGVPDAVTLPDGRVRLYWVVSGDGRASEKIVSATSTDTTGTAFEMDNGFRLTGGYVDFEVLQAVDGDWVGVMSSSPENLPETPQGLFVGTSKDGIEWEVSPVNIAPSDMSYLDPTGIPQPDGSFLIVMAVAPNEMGDRDYTLSVTTLSVGD